MPPIVDGQAQRAKVCVARTRASLVHAAPTCCPSTRPALANAPRSLPTRTSSYSSKPEPPLTSTFSSTSIRASNTNPQLHSEFSTSELRTVGNYTLGKLIGKGSFGKVYLASHKLTNGSKVSLQHAQLYRQKTDASLTQVVLKSAKKDDTNLAREIHHHRQFMHPHIARLYEVIVTENMVWLVLEYCPGKCLYEACSGGCER